MFWKDIKTIIRHKAVYIVVIGIIGALCAVGAKYLFTPEVTLKGDFIYSRIIRINDTDKTGFNYAGILTGNVSYENFITMADTQDFDYSKVYSNWDRIDDQKKIEWLQRSIRIRGYRNNTFEISYRIPSSNITDLPYLKQHAEKWMDEFLLNGEKQVTAARPRARVQTVNSALISPLVIKNDKNSIMVRNAVYGFIAGIFLSAVVFVGIPFYKQR